MAAEKTTTLVYDKWSAGEFGTMAPSHAPEGSWTGNNVVVYRNGFIGPRPGTRLVDQGVPGVIGQMRGFGFSPVGSEGATPIFFIVGTHVYLFDPAGTNTLTEADDELDIAPSANNVARVLSKESVRLLGDFLYFSVSGDKTYALNCRTQELNPISGSAQGTDIETYRDRIYVADGSRRINYSEPVNYLSWPAPNFFDIGPSWRIINLSEFRDTMLIFTESGTWVQSGEATDGTLRRISDTLSPQDKAVVKTNDDIVYVPASRSAPVSFNGSYGDEESLDYLENWKSASRACYGVQSYGNRDVLFLADNGRLLWRKNGAWTYHSVENGVGPWITRYFDDNVLLGTTGSDSDDPDFYMLAMNLDRPAFTSDTWAQPGDNSDTPLQADFTIPDYFDEAGHQLRVRYVTVDFVKYNTGSSVANNIEFTIRGLARTGNPGSGTQIGVGKFNEAGTAASTGGTRDRLTVRVGQGGYVGGFNISLNNLRGVAIDRVIVDIETEETRPNA